MNSKITLGIVLVLSCILSSCKAKKDEHALPPVDVTDFTVEKKTIPVVLDFMGFVKSPHPVEIRSKVEGYLDKIGYEEGSIVKEGDLMFQIDPRPFQAAVEEAKGEVARQEALLQNATFTVDRLTPLYEQKAASKKDLDNAIANKLATNAALISAKANLLKAEINLGYTTIQSPITGASGKARFREGALINPSSNTLMTTVSVLDPIWIYFSVSDNDILKLRKQTAEHALLIPPSKDYEIEAILSDGSIFPHKGKVNFTSPTYDQATGTIEVRAVFDNPEAILRPGQFARVKVYGAQRPEALYVPQRALLQKSNGMYVYLIDADNKVSLQAVSVGGWYGEYQVITNGLKEGDKIVVDGITKVTPGRVVHITGTWKPKEQTETMGD